ncbi:MAG: hypothetical protein QOI80_1088 [Solirubrobacteraceae bacterium]|jgi:hypothetical protein|nr:hypothetical protein [Solirubrobacteraceae bacterium]
MSLQGLRGGLERRDPFWPAQLAVLCAIALGVALPSHLTIGTPWLVPAVEAVLLVGLVLTTPAPPTEHDQRRRFLRIGLVGVVSAVNVISLFVLAQALLENSKVSGRTLLEGGVILWLTAVLLFAVWFWELDRGGPVRRLLDDERLPDFLFPTMYEEDWTPEDWRPQLVDYLYLSLVNASGFSPAETIPLTRTAKVLMSVQTLASLTTLAVTLAYAVGNLN